MMYYNNVTKPLGLRTITLIGHSHYQLMLPRNGVPSTAGTPFLFKRKVKKMNNNEICKIKNDNPKCDEIFKKQCLSTYGSKQCKLRFFNDRCLMALKNKEKEGKKNEN